LYCSLNLMIAYKRFVTQVGNSWNGLLEPQARLQYLDWDHGSSRPCDATLHGSRLNPHRCLCIFRSQHTTRGAVFDRRVAKDVLMTVRFSRDVAVASLDMRVPRSGLVRRLLFRSQDDAARRRMLTWLLAVDDAQLLKFGLSAEDIALLRMTTRGRRTSSSRPRHLPPDEMLLVSQRRVMLPGETDGGWSD
jgi:hypothetical protein